MPITTNQGLRYYGFHVAHQASECLNLLHAEIARLRQLHAEACEIAAQHRAERDAALAKITAHNAAMDAECETQRLVWRNDCSPKREIGCITCPRRQRIEVDG
jgi:hypothetical protein